MTARGAVAGFLAGVLLLVLSQVIGRPVLCAWDHAAGQPARSYCTHTPQEARR